MSYDGGFVDLRADQSENGAEDSFWPSFTDIMTVIVMIFLLAMVVVLIRNMELVNELRATMEAERHAAELARTTDEEKESLALQLIATENELSMLRLQVMRLEEQRDEQEIAIASQQRQLLRIGGERDELATLSRKLTVEGEQLRDQYRSAQRSLEGLRQDYERLQTRYTASTQELEALRRVFRTQEQELSGARARIRETDLLLADAETEFADLKQKYDKLIKPARSPRGRFLVEVRYSKQGNRHEIAFRPQGVEEFEVLTREELERRLQRLDKQHPDGLYIKVIFPENSGLSYSEAWNFTSQLHKRYDYYFRGNGTSEATDTETSGTASGQGQ